MIRKADVFLMVFFALMAFMSIFILNKVKVEGATATIYLDSKVYERLSLSEDNLITIDNNGRHNVIEIKDGKATMTEANCPDGLCLGQNPVNSTLEVIVCLPNKVVVEVDGDDASQIDAIAN